MKKINMDISNFLNSELTIFNYLFNNIQISITNLEKQILEIKSGTCEYLKLISQKISSLLGILLLILNNLKDTENFELISNINCSNFNNLRQSIYNYYNYLCNFDDIDFTAHILQEFIFKFNLLSPILNYTMILNDSNFLPKLKKIISVIISCKYELYNTIESSKILKLEKSLFSKVKRDLIYNTLSILKEIYDSQSDHQLNPAKKILICLFINLYSSFDEEMLDENWDTIIHMTIKALENGIKLRLSSLLLKKLIKFFEKDFLRKTGLQVKHFIDIFLKVIFLLNQVIGPKQEIEINVNLLKCLYKLKLVSPNWEDKVIKSTIKCLKPLLSHNKRVVRKFCGMCINILMMNN